LNGLKEAADTILVQLDVMIDVLNVVKEDILLAIAEDAGVVVVAAENEVIVPVAIDIVQENVAVVVVVDPIAAHLLKSEVVAVVAVVVRSVLDVVQVIAVALLLKLIIIDQGHVLDREVEAQLKKENDRLVQLQRRGNAQDHLHLKKK